MTNQVKLPEMFNEPSANISYNYNVNSFPIDPQWELCIPYYAKILGTNKVMRISLSARIVRSLFEIDTSVAGPIINFVDDGEMAWPSVGGGQMGALINRDTGIRVVLGRGGYALREDSYPKLCELVSELRWEIPPPKRDVNVFDDIHWDEDSIIFRRDFEFFIKSRGWFDLRELDYTRSYLLFGPPGNGKTLSIKRAAQSVGADVDSFNFAHPSHHDGHFQNWLGNEDRDGDYLLVKVMEDLDRFFPKSGEPQTKVTMSAILNGLDGAVPHHNTIIIATCNHPENLDSVVMARPGRFDRKVYYAHPVLERRIEFLVNVFKHDSDVSKGMLEDVAVRMEYQSYAMLKEVLKSSAAICFARTLAGSDDIQDLVIADADVDAGTEELLHAADKEQEHIARNEAEKERRASLRQKARNKILGSVTSLLKRKNGVTGANQ